MTIEGSRVKDPRKITVCVELDDELLGRLDAMREQVRSSSAVPLTMLPSRSDLVRAAIISMSDELEARDAAKVPA